MLHGKFLLLKNIAKNSELITGYAISQFLESMVKALLGDKDVVETGFVAAPEDSPARYLTSLIDLNEQGIEVVYGPPKSINRYEKKILYPAILTLQRDIKHAEHYVLSMQKAELMQSK